MRNPETANANYLHNGLWPSNSEYIFNFNILRFTFEDGESSSRNLMVEYY